ncbi:hypothetical protein FOL47_009047 [Perkinsus chesapeaki]|uniref:Uncharacterized protein n=1 Tax=Perkinsus chesapeaki TaxID=330153 RepID=A0A7J6LAK5_PERCH|nr:hypothetical protein FOL47_009047 [Perkinsus chesapeaki]
MLCYSVWDESRGAFALMATIATEMLPYSIENGASAVRCKYADLYTSVEEDLIRSCEIKLAAGRNIATVYLMCHIICEESPRLGDTDMNSPLLTVLWAQSCAFDQGSYADPDSRLTRVELAQPVS